MRGGRAAPARQGGDEGCAVAKAAGFGLRCTQAVGRCRDDMTRVGILVYITQFCFDGIRVSKSTEFFRIASNYCSFRRMRSDYVNGKLEQFAKKHIVLTFQIW